MTPTRSALDPNGSASSAAACVAAVEADRILAGLRIHLIAQLKSHQAPAFHHDIVLGSGTPDARIVTVIAHHRFVGAGQ